MKLGKEELLYARRGLIVALANFVVTAILIYVFLQPTIGHFIIFLTAILLVSTAGAMVASVSSYRKYIKPIKYIESVLTTDRDNVLEIEFDKKSLGELTPVAESIENFVNPVKEMIGFMNSSSEEVASSVLTLSEYAEANQAISEEMLENISNLANASEQQKVASQETAIAMQQMAAGVQQIASSSGTASDLAAETNAKAHEGHTTIQKSVDQMLHIKESFDKIKEAITSLQNRSEEIGNFVDIITKISSDTNLLALNASILAAEAGEQGRGFSVVAEEVRRLSQQSDASAKQVKTAIEGIQHDLKLSSSAMAEGSEEVEEGMKVVDFAGQAFEDILTSIEQVVMEIGSITASAQEMAAVSEQVTASVEEVSGIVTQNADQLVVIQAAAEEQALAVSEMNDSSQRLNGVVESLNSQMSRF